MMGPSAFLHLLDDSVLFSQQSTRIAEQAVFAMFDTSGFQQEGQGFFLENACELLCLIGTRFYLYLFEHTKRMGIMNRKYCYIMKYIFFFYLIEKKRILYS